MPPSTNSFGPWSWFVNLYFVISLFALLKYVLKWLPRVFYCNHWTFFCVHFRVIILMKELHCETELLPFLLGSTILILSFYIMMTIVTCVHHLNQSIVQSLSSSFLSKVLRATFLKGFVLEPSRAWSMRTLLKFELVYHHDHDHEEHHIHSTFVEKLTKIYTYMVFCII